VYKKKTEKRSNNVNFAQIYRSDQKKKGGGEEQERRANFNKIDFAHT
jgi:hypothetical protein